MINYYEHEQAMQARGIDWDLASCIEYNPPGIFVIEDIEHVLAVWEGENDGGEWRWIIALKDGTFIFAQGGCDYTGWDCQSSAMYTPADSAERALDMAKQGTEVHTKLKEQLETAKTLTWHERTGQELGLL